MEPTLDEWTVVVSRKQRKKVLQPRKGLEEEKKVKPRKGQEEEEEEEKEQPWKPKGQVDPERQARLIEEMQSSMWKTKRSYFYTAFFQQLKSPKVLEQFRLLLGTETQLQMVIYGLGSIEEGKHGRIDSRIQLSIALSMKREFGWIGEIQAFDPIFSATECSVLESLGCTVLSVNEHARRVALKPTLFFMPHCVPDLYKNLLQANWRRDRMSNIALLGNSFNQNNYGGATRTTREFAIKNSGSESDHYFTAFCNLSWHFFSPGVDTELPFWDFGRFPPLTK